MIYSEVQTLSPGQTDTELYCVTYYTVWSELLTSEN